MMVAKGLCNIYSRNLQYITTYASAVSKGIVIPVQTWTGPQCSRMWSYQISRQSAHEGGKFVNPMRWPPYPPVNIPGTHSCFMLSRPWDHNAAGRINPLKPQLNPICYLLALLAHHFLHVSRIRVKSLTLRLLMSYIYINDISSLRVNQIYTVFL